MRAEVTTQYLWNCTALLRFLPLVSESPRGCGRHLHLQAEAEALAYDEAEDLINIGAYAQGSNPRIDRALGLIEPLRTFLGQTAAEGEPFDTHVQRLMGLLEAENAADTGAA